MFFLMYFAVKQTGFGFLEGRGTNPVHGAKTQIWLTEIANENKLESGSVEGLK